jgi:cytochrome c biogenesis protein CcdA
VTALTVATTLARAGLVGRLRTALPYVARLSGALLVVAGAYVAWYGWFEVRTLAGGSGDDPVVDRATEVQAWLQRSLLPDDPVSAVGVLAVVLGATAGIVWWRRRPSITAATEAPGIDTPAERVPLP